MKQMHKHPFRRSLSLALTITTLFMLTVFVPPVSALSAGDTLYLTTEEQAIQLVVASFKDGDGQLISSEGYSTDNSGFVMSDEGEGVYAVTIPENASQVYFNVVYVDPPINQEFGYSPMSLVEVEGNAFNLDTGEWYDLNSSSIPDETETESDTTEETGSTFYTDQEGQNTATITPSGLVGSSSEAEEVVAVDLSWEAMEFTYTPASQGDWNPEEHAYEGTVEAGWTSDTNGITITNHSNVDITVSFDFESAQDLELTGVFRDDSNENVQSVDLATAENAAGGTGEATTETVTFHITEGSITEATPALGTITLTIEKKSE